VQSGKQRNRVADSGKDLRLHHCHDEEQGRQTLGCARKSTDERKYHQQQGQDDQLMAELDVHRPRRLRVQQCQAHQKDLTKYAHDEQPSDDQICNSERADQPGYRCSSSVPCVTAKSPSMSVGNFKVPSRRRQGIPFEKDDRGSDDRAPLDGGRRPRPALS
jgi:hypothetical protein